MFDILGQEVLKDLFRASINKDRVSHSYLIEGEMGLGKMEMAKFIAASLLCTSLDSNGACTLCSNCKRIDKLSHPDLRVIDEDTVKIDTIRSSIEEVHKKPYEGRRKVLIIKNFHTATTESQNAILKTLEEPPNTATIILLAENTLNILDTIKSRCQILKVFRVDTSLVRERLIALGIDEKKADFASLYSEGNLGVALRACSDEFLKLREEIIDMGLNIFSCGRFKALEYGESLMKHKDNIKEVLNIFTSLYRDIIMLKLKENNDNVINRDKLEILVEESYRLSYNKLDKSLRVIKETRDKLTRDTNFQLTMEVMILSIQEAK
ncbi:ATP-binding protein [Clostridium cylindrosporum]|uniref:DNA polymerase III subunit delta' n=1 Tax=Clostridium cylindrosporum DSM 605 TaxID=1121307 RepID=A0A0J8G5L8_CLOCY|nr:DNA polymerase III subunit delta' C-terminal domain-containing protein [Clostridium cylindrosporum]KMT22946.1 DNA polymerase III subunit delta' [Clostridium cylindrosporum DSM 605]